MKIKVLREGLLIKALDSLVKVFPDEEPVPTEKALDLSLLRGDRLSFQLAFGGEGTAWKKPPMRFVRITAEAPEALHVTLRSVENVPVRYPAHEGAPEGIYVRQTPGLYPDVLWPLKNGVIGVSRGSWRALWIDLEADADAGSGDLPLRILVSDPVTGESLAEAEGTVTVLPAVLPEQAFPRTEWFHADCLADACGTGIFSEAHWQIIRNFVSSAVKRGINMILTPQFTPPLDTAVGWERPTVQLVEVTREGNSYRFGFDKLERWIRLCLECRAKYFEMSHLFSQWGAKAAPKVMGWENGEYKQLFGWDDVAVGGEYTRFLGIYLPELRKVLRALGVEEKCFFHISDEPSLDQLPSYGAALSSVKEALKGCRFLEALSNYEFYQKGYVETPVCGSSHIAPFLEAQTPHLWSYYCTAQSNHVSNCFIAQSSGVTRLYGAQMYKFGIEGSLRWGYNFYYTAESYERIDPYLVNDGGGCYPAGDAFLVYPGPGGECIESIRLMVLDDAVRDLRALKALEKKIGRAAVVRMVDEGLSCPLAFDVFPDHPADGEYVLGLRRRVNAALCGRA